MKPAAAVARTTLRQLTGQRRAVGLLALALLPGLIQLAVSLRRQQDAGQFFRDVTLGVLFGVAIPIIAVVISTAALGEERRGDTLSFVLLRPIRREVVLLAKLAAGWASASIIAGVGALAAGAALGVGGDWGKLLPLLGGTFVSALAYTGVFLPLGYLTERAVIIGLAYVFVWEGAIASGLSQITGTSLGRIGISAYADLAGQSRFVLSDVLGVVQPGFWGAAAKAVVLSAAGLALLAVLMRRRDLV